MKKWIIAAAFLVSAAGSVWADEPENTTLSVSLTTEGEWNTSNGQANWMNLLDVSVEQRLWRGATLTGDVLAAYNYRLHHHQNWSVANDMQVFSNILLDEQIPLSLFQFSIDQQLTDNFLISFGVRNLNGNFFCKKMTGLFLGSSHGIYPTLSTNWNVGNYPASSLTLFWQWEFARNFYWKNAFQNGQASTAADEAFRFRPGRDGVVNVTELSYSAPADESSLWGEYHLGAVYGNRNADAEKVDNFAVYGLVEQPLVKGNRPLGLLLQGSYSKKRSSDAYAYWGAGLVAENILSEGDALGLVVNRVLCAANMHETAVELTYNIPVTAHLSVQPAFTFVRTNGVANHIGVLRAVFEY